MTLAVAVQHAYHIKERPIGIPRYGDAATCSSVNIRSEWAELKVDRDEGVVNNAYEQLTRYTFNGLSADNAKLYYGLTLTFLDRGESGRSHLASETSSHM